MNHRIYKIKRAAGWDQRQSSTVQEQVQRRTSLSATLAQAAKGVTSEKVEEKHAAVAEAKEAEGEPPAGKPPIPALGPVKPPRSPRVAPL